MAAGFPVKANWAAGDIYTAAGVDDMAASLNLIGNSPFGKNAVINGGMDVWQRGTSIATLGNLGGYTSITADLWHLYRSGGVTGATVSRQSSGLTGIQYCARVQRDSGNTSTAAVALRYTLQSADSYRFAGQTVVLSFYARAGANYSSASNNLSVTLASGSGQDQPVYAFTSYTSVASGTPVLTTSWQRFQYTGIVGATATEMGIEISFTPVGTAGAADYFEITGVQIEQGSLASPFARTYPNIEGEIAACQQFYWRFFADDPYSPYATGICTNATSGTFVVQNPVPMRIAPTSLEYSNLGITDVVSLQNAVSTLTLPHPGRFASLVNFAGTTGFAAYRTVQLTGQNSTSAFLGFYAGLY